MCVWIHMCIFAFCVHACAFSHMCICMFDELEATTLHFGVGVVCEGMPPRLSSSCTANKAGTPRLALGGMLQRIWMLGTLPRVANECSLFWWGVYHLLTCWFVQVCVV